LLRDRSNGTRGQRRRQERHPHGVASQPFRAAPQRSNGGRLEYANRPQFLNQGRTRSDLLFTMSNNTRTTRQSLGGRESFHLWTSETGYCGRGAPFSSQALTCRHSLAGTHLQALTRSTNAATNKPCAGSLSRNGCRPEASTRRQSCAPTNACQPTKTS
jgi:hypothetical protein